jgi:hypothetical protein
MKITHGHASVLYNPRYIVSLALMPAKKEHVPDKVPMIDVQMVLSSGQTLDFSTTEKFGLKLQEKFNKIWYGEEEPLEEPS